MLLVMASSFHECVLQLVVMHYIFVSGMVVRAIDISIINSGLINRYVRCLYSNEVISRASALLN